MNTQCTEDDGNKVMLADDLPLKELLWPPHGHVYQQEFMLPAYCKPKLIPLKSVTMDKLEKMQAENAEKLRNFEHEEAVQQTKNGNQQQQNAVSNFVRDQSGLDIWRAEE